MFSRSTGETDELLGGSAAALGSGGARRGTVTVNRGHLYYGDPASANPPPAASSGRRYQGGVSFEDTLVDVGDSSASSSDGEYSYVEDSSPAFRHIERRARREQSGLGSTARGDRARRGEGGGFGVWTAVFTIAVCAVLAVVGLIVGGVIPAESLPVPAGVLQAFQVSAPGIAKSDDLDENLSQKEKSVRDVRASHASTSSREEEKEEEKETKETKEKEEEEHEAKSKRREDDDDDDEVVLLGRDERDFVAASKAADAESREPAAGSKAPRRAGVKSLSADYDDARTRAKR
jgi:hypothetical protein